MVIAKATYAETYKQAPRIVLSPVVGKNI